MRTVHLAIYNTLADWEFGYVTAGIGEPQFQREPGSLQIRTVGAGPEPITSLGGLRILPDTTLADISPEDSAMLVLPGASIWEDGDSATDAFTAAATRWVGAGVPVAGICGATIGLARAGLLDDRAHTSNAPEQLTPTGYRGADHYVGAPAVTDRGVITAGAVAPVDFAREVFATLGVYDDAVLGAWHRLYADQDPQGFYDLMAATQEGATGA